MRDPFCNNKPIYELLELSAESSSDQIKHKLGTILAGNGNASFNHIFRTYLLEYPEPILRKFSSTLSLDLNEFKDGNRYDTCSKLERFFRTNFPNDEIAHLVNAFYYWSLKKLEDTLAHLLLVANAEHIEIHTANNLIEVIEILEGAGTQGYYQGEQYISTSTLKSLIVNDPVPEFDFLLKRFGQSGAIMASANSYWEHLLQRSASNLTNFFGGMADHYDKFLNGFKNRMDIMTKPKEHKKKNEEDSEEDEVQYREPIKNEAFVKKIDVLYKNAYKLFLSELKLAQKMAKAILRYRGTRINCGLSMLKDFHLESTLKDQISYAIEQNPKSELLKDIQKELSAYHRLVDLVDKKQYSLALAEINKMTSADRGNAEICDLSAVIHFHLGADSLKKGNLTDLSMQWKKALDQPKSKKKKVHFSEQMASIGRQEAERCAKNDLRKAVDILKCVNAIVPNASNKLVMANFMVKSAQKEINSIVSKSKKGSFRVERQLIKTLAEIVKDLQRAVRLGHQGAKKQLRRAEQLLQEAKSGLLGLTDKSRSLLLKASKISHMGNFEGAVSVYRKLLSEMGANKSEQVNHQLADTLLKLVRTRIDKAINLSSAQGVLARGLSMRPGGSHEAIELLHLALNELQPIKALEPRFATKVAKLRAEIEGLLPKAKLGPLSPTKASRPAMVTQVVPMNLSSSLKWLFAAFLFAMVTIIIILGQWKFLMILLPLLAVSVLISSSSHSQKR